MANINIPVPATAASMFLVSSVRIAPSGDIYTTDNLNTVRKVSPFHNCLSFQKFLTWSVLLPCWFKVTSSGVVMLVAGTAGQYGNTGNGSPAAGPATTLNAPNSVVLTSMGDVYIADSGNCVIRKVRFDISTGADEIKEYYLRRWIRLESSQ